jgi:hypothetical protein
LFNGESVGHPPSTARQRPAGRPDGASANARCLLRSSLRFLTWVCVVVLTILSLAPSEEIEGGTNPALVDFAASAFGALCGGIAIVLLRR